jgi:hypothetical protein
LKPYQVVYTINYGVSFMVKHIEMGRWDSLSKGGKVEDKSLGNSARGIGVGWILFSRQ